MKTQSEILSEIAALNPVEGGYSQLGMESVVEYLCQEIGLNDLGPVHFVDIGAGHYGDSTMSNTLYFEKKYGWTGIKFDGMAHPGMVQAFIDKDNIIQLLNLHFGSRPLNFLSIDIDGNDFYVLKEIMKVRKPDIIVCELNQNFNDARVIEYNPEHRYAGDDYYGFTFKAGCELAKFYGYIPVHVVKGQDMVMVHRCHLPQFDLDFRPSFLSHRVHIPCRAPKKWIQPDLS